jgi:hypothetical protein
MSRRAAILILTALFVCGTSAAVAAAHLERISFVGKCWANGNQLTECACTFDALGELPKNYRALAISWAHDTRTAYATTVMRVILAEFLRAGTTRIKDIWAAPDREKRIGAWVSAIATVLGWSSSGTDALSVAATLAAEAGPIMYDVGADLLSARSTLDRHCARGESFVVRINKMRLVAEKVASELGTDTVDAAIRAGTPTVDVTMSAAQRFWLWLKSWTGK